MKHLIKQKSHSLTQTKLQVELQRVIGAAQVVLEREELPHHLPLPEVSLIIESENHPQGIPPCLPIPVESGLNLTDSQRIAPPPRLIQSLEEAPYPKVISNPEEESSAIGWFKCDFSPGERKASRDDHSDKQKILEFGHEKRSNLGSNTVLMRPRQAIVTQRSASFPAPASQKEHTVTASYQRELPKQAKIIVNQSGMVRLPKQAIMSFSASTGKSLPVQSLSGAARFASTFAKMTRPGGNQPPRTSYRSSTPSGNLGGGVPLPLLKNPPEGHERNNLLVVGGVSVALPSDLLTRQEKNAERTSAKTHPSEGQSLKVSSSLSSSLPKMSAHGELHQRALQNGPVVGPPMLLKTVEPGITIPVPVVGDPPPVNINRSQLYHLSEVDGSSLLDTTIRSSRLGSSRSVATDAVSGAPGVAPDHNLSQIVEGKMALPTEHYREKDTAALQSNLDCGALTKETIWGCEFVNDQSFLCRYLSLIHEALFRPDPDYVGRWEPLIASQFYTDVPRPITQLTFRWDWAHLALYPDRGEYLWARADGQGRGPAPHPPWQGIKSVDYHELTLIAEINSGPLSAIMALPYRSVNPSIYADSAAGFSDLSITGKGLLFDTELLLVTFLLKTSVPTGNFNKGLGVGHVSLEPSIVMGLRLGPRTYGLAQVAEWIPIGGDRDYAGAALRWNFAWNQMLWQPIPDIQLIGTFEVMGLSFQDGAYTDPIRGSNQKLSGQTFVSLSPGARLFCGDTCDFGLAYAVGVTGKAYAQDQLRMEFRYRY